MLVEKNVPLQPCNTFRIVAKAQALLRVTSQTEVQTVVADREWGDLPKFVLGGGSNIVLTGDVKALVLKVEIKGRWLIEEAAKSIVVEAGAGENWHDFVSWTL